jgi:hypothetical protein
MFRGAGEQLAYALGTSARPDIQKIGLMLRVPKASDPLTRLHLFERAYPSAQPGIRQFEKSVNDAKALEDEDTYDPASAGRQSTATQTSSSSDLSSNGASSDSLPYDNVVAPVASKPTPAAAPPRGFLRDAIVAWLIKAIETIARMPLLLLGAIGGYIFGLIATRARKSRRSQNLPASYFAHSPQAPCPPRPGGLPRDNRAPALAGGAARNIPLAHKVRRYIEI